MDPILTFIIGGTLAALEPLPRDTGDATVAPVIREWPSPVGVRPLAGRLVATDTPRTRTRATEVSDWYQRRLLVHRVTAFAIPALFAYQYYLGNKLYDAAADRRPEPAWVRPAHERTAAFVAGAFGINAVTGFWNLWDSRRVEQGRGRRTLHGLSMLGAMGGFAYAGLRLADDAKTALSYEAAMDKRRQHRAVALGSMGLTLVSGTAMWLVNR